MVLNRQEREKCWNARDAYFQCLGMNDEVQDACAAFFKEFQDSCPSSWVSHFTNQRKTQQKYAQLPTQQNQDQKQK